VKTFSKDIRESMHQVSSGYCQCSLGCVKPITEFDHILANTKANNKNFPLLLHSPFNCLGINNACHAQKGKSEISLYLAKVYEDYLRNLKGGDQK